MYVEREKHHFLKEWRERRNLSQLQLARIVGVNKSIISRYESQQCAFTTKILFKLLDALQVDPNQFFEGPGESSISETPSPEKVRGVLKLVENALNGR